ncbi:MAG: ABC transporter permease [Candidatus Aenigmarchaeota archaeon]|nr:ABC transporter permease [Candidatus Aenigmarchaeota archaeon]
MTNLHIIVKNPTDEDASDVVVSVAVATLIGPPAPLQPATVPKNDEYDWIVQVSRNERYYATCNSTSHKPDRHSKWILAHNPRINEITFTLQKEPKEKHFKDVYATWSILQFLPILLLLGAGVVLANAYNSTLFLVAFLSWILYYVIPAPSEFEVKPPKWVNKMLPYGHGARFSGTSVRNPLPQARRLEASFAYIPDAWNGMWGGNRGRHHLRSAWLRTMFKVLTILFLSLAFLNSTFPFANLAAILAAFIGYYSLGISFRQDEPSEYVESLGRFILGLIIIPFMILANIFDSFVLAIIGFAFFAIPPIIKNEGDVQGQKVIQEGPLRVIFILCMLIALFGSGTLSWATSEQGTFLGFPTWGLGQLSVLGDLFLYFWLVTFIAGAFSPAETRPYTGFLMLGVAVLIFALGPGTQEFGSALLGPWFPTIYEGLSQVVTPIGSAFGGIGNLFGNAFFLITNPTGYAQSILNGSYAKDPDSGLAGAFGVEITDTRTSPIVVGQPYTAFIKIQNKGYYEARNVEVSLRLGAKAPEEREGRIRIGGTGAGDEIVTLQGLGFTASSVGGGARCTTENCSVWMDEKDPAKATADPAARNVLQKVDLRQLFFQSDGTFCPAVQQFNLREQFIPLDATVSYDYEIDSTLEVEVISQREWNRLLATNQFFTQNKIPSSFNNAPVRLNLDTLEQPIREGTPLYVALHLDSAKKNGKASDARIKLHLPDGLVVRACTPKEQDFIGPKIDSGALIWTPTELKGSNLVYCTLMPLSLGSTPSRTFQITAHADYRFTESKGFTPDRVEFGGQQICCDDKEDCPGGMVCSNKQCTVGGAVPLPGEEGYCASVRATAGMPVCDLGWGKCADDSECKGAIGVPPSPNTCRKDVQGGVCCPASASSAQCEAAFTTFRSCQTSGASSGEADQRINEAFTAGTGNGCLPDTP